MSDTTTTPAPTTTTPRSIRKYHPQFGPLEINPTTGEPFLRLRKHRDIILTPPRPSDAHGIVPHLNDARVNYWLGSVPVPYLPSDGEWFLNLITPRAEETLAKLDEAAQSDQQDLIKAEHPPVRYIRHLQTNEKGEQFDVLIGDIGMTRAARGELFTLEGELRDKPDWDKKADWETQNGPETLELGDPRIIWEPGYWLTPAYHGQGIMPDVLDTLIHEWCIPRMGCRKFIGLTLNGNASSRRVFEKNGFTFKMEYEFHQNVRGEDRGLVVLELEVKSMV